MGVSNVIKTSDLLSSFAYHTDKILTMCPLRLVFVAGDVIIFVPATYSGVMRAESVKGTIRFLPCFASHMRVLKETDREKMVMFGEDLHDELCEVSTRSGQIVVGLAGRDEYKKAGLWQRLFE